MDSSIKELIQRLPLRFISQVKLYVIYPLVRKSLRNLYKVPARRTNPTKIRKNKRMVFIKNLRKNYKIKCKSSKIKIIKTKKIF